MELGSRMDELLFFVVVILGAIIFGISALVKKSRRDRERFHQTDVRLRELTRQLDRLHKELAELRADRRPAPVSTPVVEGPLPIETSAVDEPPAKDEPARGRKVGAFAASTGGARASPVTPPDYDNAKGLEEALTSRWLVWLGAVTIALGGTFLVKYAIDEALLAPSVRVVLGVLLAVC